MLAKPRAVISLSNLEIAATHRTPMLNSISLDVWEGNCLAVLGLPGSGKTMLVKALAGLIRITSGRGIVLNYVFDDPQLKNNASIGILHQSVNWPGSLSVEEVLNSKVDTSQMDTLTKFEDMAKVAGLLDSIRTKSIHELSVKERQIVDLISLYLKDPKLLIIDNPANELRGCDRLEVLDFLAYIGRNKTIFFTTSHLVDVQHVASHVAILHNGTILAYGEKDTIFAQPHTSIYRVVLRGNTKIVHKYVSNLDWVSIISEKIDDGRTIWELAIEEQDNIPTRFLRVILADQNLTVIEFVQIRPRIDTFLKALANVNTS